MKTAADVIELKPARGRSRPMAKAGPAAADFAALNATLEEALDMAMQLNLRFTALQIGNAIDSLEMGRTGARPGSAWRELD